MDNVCNRRLVSFPAKVEMAGVANGKIRDSPRSRDPSLKIRDRDLNVIAKSEPETSFCENPSRFRKLFAARHELHDILR